MRVAIVHDSMTVYGGAEKVLEELHRTFPEAPIYTSIYDPAAFPERLRGWEVRTSWMNRLPRARRYHRALFPLYPAAMGMLDLRGFDVILSSSFNFAHHVVADPGAVHVCYCHSPARFLWDAQNYAEHERFGPVSRLIHGASLATLRARDRAAATGVTRFIATSTLVRSRIRRFWGRDSVIVPPPIDMGEFHVAEARPEQPYFLMLLRLVRWKRPDIVIEACSRLGLPLKVAGFGREDAALRRIAGPSVEFLGPVDGAAKARLLAGCRALILPSSEDFGITPLEAMASGRPVVALRAGGALDTVVEGRTGAFFEEQSAESLAAVLAGFDDGAFQPAHLRHHAAAFDRDVFRRRVREEVEAALAEDGLRDAPWGRQGGGQVVPLAVPDRRAASQAL